MGLYAIIIHLLLGMELLIAAKGESNGEMV
jgi:hypothetical protein